MDELVYRSEYPSDASRHLGHLSGGDVAEDQVCLVLSSPFPRGRVEICYDGDLAVGVIQFTREPGPEHLYLRHFSVIPSHQRQGIGRSLLERVQAIARKEKLPIFVRDVSEDAIRSLEKRGFWQVGGIGVAPTFKWSDLPEHINNDHPQSDSSA